MRELELDGIHDDGEHLILVDSEGTRFTVRIDAALRAAVRTDRPALGAIQAASSAPVRPREIQAMLRAGRSAEEISESADIPLEHVRRYEGPVLAEREWTAQRAGTFPVGRGGPALLEVVRERLLAREAAGDTAWDAWRRPDGTWTLELTFAAGGRTRQAQWIADLETRTVTPIDDEARWISDEDAPPAPTRGPARLMAVKSAVYDVESDDSIDETTGAPRRSRNTWPGARPGRTDQPGRPSAFEEDELEALNARRGLRSVPPLDDGGTVWSSLADEETPETAPARATGSDEPGDLDETADPADREALAEHDATRPATGISERDEDQDPVAEDDIEAAGPDADETAPETSADQEEPAEGSAPIGAVHHQETVDLTPLPGFDHLPSARSASDESEDPAAEDAPAKPARPARSKSKRSSIPSWDEIVFGSKHD